MSDSEAVQRMHQLYSNQVTRKKEYKNWARRYKQMLRKRDKEIMDMIIEGKSLRQKIEQDHFSQEEMKQNLRNEINLIKDDLQAEVRKSQMELAYEKDKNFNRE